MPTNDTTTAPVSIILPDDDITGLDISAILQEPTPPTVSRRLKQRFRDLGVAFIGGAEEMTDEQLTEAAAKLLQWRDHRLAEGAPLLPDNVCTKCFRPHRENEEECRL